MSIYRFGDNSLIDEVTFHHTPGGGVRAYLHAREGTTPAQLDGIKQALKERHSLQWTPIGQDGRPMLEVRGFDKHEDRFLRMLSREGVIHDENAKEHIPDDKIPFWEKLKRNTLRVSGLSYFIGDASYLKYSILEAFDRNRKLVKPQSLTGGIFYALGTPFIAIFGRGDKSNLQLKHLSYSLVNHMRESNIDIPEDAAVNAEANGHNTTLRKKIISFCSRYPAEITNAIFAAAGSMILWEKIVDVRTFKWTPLKILKENGGWLKSDGWKALRESMNRTQNIRGQSAHSLTSVIKDMGLGSMSIAAGLISVFVEEEVPKPDEPKKHGLARVWQWVKEKPLRAASLMLMGATTTHAFSTWDDMQHVKRTDLSPYKDIPLKAWPDDAWETQNLKKALPGRAIFVATNLTAEALMAMSSKGHGSGVISDVSFERSAYAMAADLIQRTTPDKQEAMLNMLAKFYAEKVHLGRTADVHVKGIREQLAAMNDNPWAKTQPAPAGAAPAREKENTHWQSKLAAPQLTPATAPAL